MMKVNTAKSHIRVTYVMTFSLKYKPKSRGAPRSLDPVICRKILGLTHLEAPRYDIVNYPLALLGKAAFNYIVVRLRSHIMLIPQ